MSTWGWAVTVQDAMMTKLLPLCILAEPEVAARAASIAAC